MDLIKNRWSPRAFDEKEVTKVQMDTILEAATWAPSCMNEQPWRYAVALKQNKNGFKKLLDLLVPGNAIWAKNSAALILCYVKTTYDSNGAVNDWAMHDAGLANENLLLQATNMGIYGHIMAGFTADKAIADFVLTNEYKPVCMIALGYPGNSGMLEEPFKTREMTPRTRKGTDIVVKFET